MGLSFGCNLNKEYCYANSCAFSSPFSFVQSLQSLSGGCFLCHHFCHLTPLAVNSLNVAGHDSLKIE